MKVKNLTGFPDGKNTRGYKQSYYDEARAEGFNIAREQIGELEIPEDKKREVSYEELKKAFIDVVDGEDAIGLKFLTSCNLKRCRRIVEMYNLLVEEK